MTLIKVLIADDHDVTRKARIEVLRKAGYTILEARNGNGALDLCRAEHPDFVLLAANLPDVSGREVCREIKATPSTHKPVVVLFSGATANVSEQISSLEEGADAYLCEPVQPELLVATVRSLLRLSSGAHVSRDAHERKFARLLAGIGFWEWNPANNEVTISSESFRHYSADARNGSMTLDGMLGLIHSHDREAVRKALLHAVEHRETYNGEFRVVWPDGSIHWLYTNASTLCDQAGTPVRVVGSTLDVTGCKECERGLHENEWKLKQLIEANILGVMETDGDRITEANRTFLQILGYAREELDAGKLLVSKITPPEYLDVITDLQEKLSANTHAEAFQMEFLRRDETRVPVLFTASVLSTKPEWLCFVLDRSEVKHAEDELVELRSKLAHSNEYLAHFAFTASHDLREPLRTITEQAQLLRREYSSKLEGTLDTRMEDILAAATRMNNLLQELLAFAQVHSTRDIPMRPTSLENVMQLVLFDLKWLIQETDAEIVHDPLPVVNGNLEQLARVFQNLIVNSIKYRRTDQRPRIRISAEQHNEEWVVRVSDNGIGFERKYANRIYEAFTRLHGRQISGSGLGLAIVKKIIEDHGGRVWADGDPGNGATFFMTLGSVEMCAESAAG